MSAKAEVRAEAARILAGFVAAGAAPVEADILLPAATLLDLYGEDIRARAYVTEDPLLGEMMLRPDFTLPLVQAHMARGGGAARYAYMGEVFRRQDHLGPRAREYLQVGFEILGAPDAAEAEAEVFAQIAAPLQGLPVRAVTGDIGALIALVSALPTSPARRSALLRHIWRPARFRALFDRFAGRTAPSPERTALLTRLAAAPAAALIAAAGPVVGLRSAEDIAARAALLLEDAKTPALPAAAVQAVEALLALSCPLSAAEAPLTALANDWPALGSVAERLGARVRALRARGLAPEDFGFEGGFGRTSLEYYDGFVFAFLGPDPKAPPLASGGRYDALTAKLGPGEALPAVGGILRPGLLAALKGGGGC